MNTPNASRLKISLALIVLGSALACSPKARGGGVVFHPVLAELEAALQGGGTVSFACSGTITLTNTITIISDTTLDASGQTVTISGATLRRLFRVTHASLYLKGLTLTDGWVLAPRQTTPTPSQDSYGGGILNEGGWVRLEGCTITNCLVRGVEGCCVRSGDGFGGALCNLGGGLLLTNCTLAGNTAWGGTDRETESAPGDGLGGAIYSAGGQVELASVTLLSNRALGGARPAAEWPLFPSKAVGGAVFATNSLLTMNGCRLAYNEALGSGRGGGEAGSALGGAIYLVGSSTGLVLHSTFSSNSVLGGYGFRNAGGPGRGGAILNGGTLLVRD